MFKSPPSLTRRHALGLLAGSVLVPQSALAGAGQVQSGRAFGTTWRAVSPAGQALTEALPDVVRIFDEIDAVFSPWRADSVVSGFNRAGAGAVSQAHLAHVTTKALSIARRSHGAFDPSVGPLVAQWGFGPILGGGRPDWRGLSVQGDAVRKVRADLTLDLCGIAKGWALDRAVAALAAAGVSDLLFELGGEFRALGQHPSGRDWRVAVEGAPSPMALRLPPGAAVATSGVWQQSYRLNGRLYSHIIDPRRQEPMASALRSVTVLAPDAMTADGWATALCAAGPEAGPALAATQGLAAVFLVQDGADLRQIRTDSIRDFAL